MDGSAVIWREGEDGARVSAAAPQPIVAKRAASGGACLHGIALRMKGSTVRYEVDLPRAIEAAQAVLRYAREQGAEARPARIAVEVTAGAASEGPLSRPGAARGEVKLSGTGGWGDSPSEWGLAAVGLGALPAGKYTLTLTSLCDGSDVALDGFFIVPEGFPLTAAEMQLDRIAISSDGYLGLRGATTVRQDVAPALTVAARSFHGTATVALALGRSVESARPLKAIRTDAGGTGAGIVTFELPDLGDGEYVAVLTGEAPPVRLVVAITLAGGIAASFDRRAEAVGAFAEELAGSARAQHARCAADLEHLAAYLKAGRQRPLAADVRRALLQAEETIVRLRADKDPYAGRTGDLRRAYRSAASGQLRVYRALVPSNYGKAARVPLVLMLHGTDQSEDFFPGKDELPPILDERGYLALCPRWDYRDSDHQADLVQLVELARREFPKIDPARTYCTGFSRGGMRTYSLAAAHPELFAAICCVAGTGDPALAERLAAVPTLILQGERDGLVPADGARRVAARMKELGQEVELHVFPLYGHTYANDGQVPQYMGLMLDYFERHRRKGIG